MNHTLNAECLVKVLNKNEIFFSIQQNRASLTWSHLAYVDPEIRHPQIFVVSWIAFCLDDVHILKFRRTQSFQLYSDMISMSAWAHTHGTHVTIAKYVNQTAIKLRFLSNIFRKIPNRQFGFFVIVFLLRFTVDVIDVRHHHCLIYLNWNSRLTT